jgi:hypothetical protein
VDAEDVGGFAHALVDVGLLEAAQLEAERHVLVDAHMRVQGVVLEDHGDVAVLRGDVVDHAGPMEMVPALISSRPATMRKVVDFPQPEGPTSTMNSRSLMWRLTLLTAMTPPS